MYICLYKYTVDSLERTVVSTWWWVNPKPVSLEILRILLHIGVIGIDECWDIEINVRNFDRNKRCLLAGRHIGARVDNDRRRLILAAPGEKAIVKEHCKLRERTKVMSVSKLREHIAEYIYESHHNDHHYIMSLLFFVRGHHHWFGALIDYFE